MARMAEPLIVSIRGRAPDMHAESWIAPNASLIGQVSLAASAASRGPRSGAAAGLVRS